MLVDATHLQFSIDERLLTANVAVLNKMLREAGGEPLRSLPKCLTIRNFPLPGQHRSFMLRDTVREGMTTVQWRYVEMSGPNQSADQHRGLSPYNAVFHCGN